MSEIDRNRLAESITERLMRGAPRGIILMQMKEFSTLTKKQLSALKRIHSFPLQDNVRKKILRAFDGDATFLDRLEVRYFTVHRIVSLRAKGHFELMERLILLCFSNTKQITVSMTEMRRRIYEIIDEVADGQVYVVTKRGKPIVWVVPYYDMPNSVDSSSADPKQKGES